MIWWSRVKLMFVIKQFCTNLIFGHRVPDDKVWLYLCIYIVVGKYRVPENKVWLDLCSYSGDMFLVASQRSEMCPVRDPSLSGELGGGIMNCSLLSGQLVWLVDSHFRGMCCLREIPHYFVQSSILSPDRIYLLFLGRVNKMESSKWHHCGMASGPYFRLTK